MKTENHISEISGRINDELFAYYMGTVSDDQRTEIEEKLLTSKTYLMDFIALKRSFELSDSNLDAVPSAKAEQKLKQDVRELFLPSSRVVDFGTTDFLKSLNFWKYRGAFAAIGIVLVLFVGGLLLKPDPNPTYISQISHLERDSDNKTNRKLIDSAGEISIKNHYL